MSIDETMLHHDLFTFLSNKDGHGKRGTTIATVKGTTVADVTKHLSKIPEDSRLAVEEVTMDFSDSMLGITRQMFPNAEIVIDCFHVMQLVGNGIEERRMGLKRAAVTETRRAEREFKKPQKARNKANARYAKTHKPRNRKNGKTLGRPRKRKNEKFVPPKMENGETKVELLTHVRCPLLKSAKDLTPFQRKSMKILFKEDRSIQRAYGLACSLRNIFKARQTLDEAKKALRKWYTRVGKSRIRELISARDTIKSKEEYVLNYFNNRSTNAAAEFLNSKIKGFRSELRGVAYLPFFMYRVMKIFG